LEARGHLRRGIFVEGKCWAERGWWDNFDAAIVARLLISEQVVDVDERIRKFGL